MSSFSFSPRRGIFFLLGCATILSGCASSYAYLPESMPRQANYPQAQEMNLRYSDIPYCTRYQALYDASDWPKGDSIEVMRKIDRRVRENFIYRADKIDSWNSHVGAVLAQEKWIGDCDDLTATVVALGRCAGVPDNRIGFILVKANGSQDVNHMLGFYTDAEGRSHAVGDTWGLTRPLLHMRQKPYAWAFARDLETWNRADPSVSLEYPDPVRATVLRP